jgi:3-oxoacyl-[acyl-carrier protein] reductase
MSTDRFLEGKTAIVTGGAKNIGRAISLSLAEAGASIAIITRSRMDAAAEVVEEITSAGGKALALQADVAVESDVMEFTQKIVDTYGRIDVLVNNASLRTHYPLQELTYERWREVMSINLDGPYLCARACIGSMVENGGGRIINIGGLSGHIGGSERTHVISSKAGLVGLTKALATEFGEQGITSNIVVPGTIDVDWEANVKRAEYPGGRGTLIGRTGFPNEIAAAVRYLASPEAAYVTGQTIHVNGGKYLP